MSRLTYIAGDQPFRKIENPHIRMHSIRQALAEGARGFCGLICPVMDARRSEVYNALFRMENGALVRLCEDRAISAKALCEEICQNHAGESVLLCGDGTAVARSFMEAEAGIALCDTPEVLLTVDAAAVARCAYRAFLRKDTVSDSALAPVYLRLPQAERERLEREKNNETK